MAELPILPLKVQRLLADTTHMTAEQFGAYCRILFTMWTQGGRLPDNEGELARISGLSLRRWRTASEPILRPLTSAGGTLSQKRLTDTWMEVQELRTRRAAAAETTNSKRWGRSADRSATRSAVAIQNQTKNLSSLPSATRSITAKELADLKKGQHPLPLGVLGEVKERGRR